MKLKADLKDAQNKNKLLEDKLDLTNKKFNTPTKTVDKDTLTEDEIELNKSVLKVVQFLNLNNKVSEMLYHL